MLRSYPVCQLHILNKIIQALKKSETIQHTWSETISTHLANKELKQNIYKEHKRNIYMNTIFFKGLFKPVRERSAASGKTGVVRPPGERNTNEGCEYLDDRIRMERPAPGYAESLFFNYNNQIKN